MKAEEIMQVIADLSNTERIKLLELLYYKHFDNRPPVDVIIREKQRAFWREEELYEQGYEEGVRDTKIEVAKKLVPLLPLTEIMGIFKVTSLSCVNLSLRTQNKKFQDIDNAILFDALSIF